MREPSVHYALWTRALPIVVVDWLGSAKPALLPQGRVLVSSANFEAAARFLSVAPEAPRQASAALADDIVLLARLFVEIAQAPLVDIRLEVVEDDGCRRFHRDRTPLRLLTTYRGPGTQIVSHKDARRAEREQDAYTGPIRELSAGTVALIRGEDQSRSQGVLHRSPPLQASGLTRLLLCLDWVNATSPPVWSA